MSANPYKREGVACARLRVEIARRRISHENAEVARSVANAAVYGLRRTRRESSSTIEEGLECLECMKGERASHV